jgi:hypothetical protein
LPRTMTKIVFAPAFRANDETAGIFHAPTRPQNRTGLRRDFGAVESRVSSAVDRVPLSMSDRVERYEAHFTATSSGAEPIPAISTLCGVRAALNVPESHALFRTRPSGRSHAT